ncbi:MAG: hypothetical protein ALAOOOJD_03123 [bacterium]|nr:hypothetical protein [bacterium]
MLEHQRVFGEIENLMRVGEHIENLQRIRHAARVGVHQWIVEQDRNRLAVLRKNFHHRGAQQQVDLLNRSQTEPRQFHRRRYGRALQTHGKTRRIDQRAGVTPGGELAEMPAQKLVQPRRKIVMQALRRLRDEIPRHLQRFSRLFQARHFRFHQRNIFFDLRQRRQTLQAGGHTFLQNRQRLFFRMNFLLQRFALTLQFHPRDFVSGRGFHRRRRFFFGVNRARLLAQTFDRRQQRGRGLAGENFGLQGFGLLHLHL